MDREDVNNKISTLYGSLAVFVAAPSRTESRIRGEIPTCLGKLVTNLWEERADVLSKESMFLLVRPRQDFGPRKFKCF